MINFKVKNSLFATYPTIFHLNGRKTLNGRGFLLKKKYFKILSTYYKFNGFFSDPPQKSMGYTYPKIIKLKNKLLDETSIVFFCNYNKKYSGKVSLDALGYHYNTIGLSESKFSFEKKLFKLVEFSKKCKSKYILFLDEHDLFCTDLDNIINIYKTFNCKILFQGDAWIFPKPDSKSTEFSSSEFVKSKKFFDKIAPKETPYKYPNSGAIILDVEYFNSISSYITNIDCYRKDNDQSYFVQTFKKFYPNMQIDYYCKIFQSTAWSNWCTINYGKLDLSIEEKVNKLINF